MIGTNFEDKYVWREVYRAEVWRPGIEETLAGIFQGFVARCGQFGEYMVALVRDPDTEIMWSASGTQLIASLEFVKEGTPVKLTYHGKVPSKAHADRAYKKFSVAVGEQRPPETIPGHCPRCGNLDDECLCMP